MKNRIQINGVWYVKEEQDIKNTFDDVFYSNPVESESILYISDLFNFECWRLKGSDTVNGIDIKYKKENIEKSITSQFFISNLIDNEYNVDWDEYEDNDYQEQITLVAKDLRKRGWI